MRVCRFLGMGLLVWSCLSLIAVAGNDAQEAVRIGDFLLHPSQYEGQYIVMSLDKPRFGLCEHKGPDKLHLSVGLYTREVTIDSKQTHFVETPPDSDKAKLKERLELIRKVVNQGGSVMIAGEVVDGNILAYDIVLSARVSYPFPEK